MSILSCPVGFIITAVKGTKNSFSDIDSFYLLLRAPETFIAAEKAHAFHLTARKARVQLLDRNSRYVTLAVSIDFGEIRISIRRHCRI